MSNYEVMKGLNGVGLVKSWTKGVQFESQARDQLKNIASLPFIHKHVAAMPDVHLGIGATVGSVIATKGAIIPAAVGVDIGCFTADTEVKLVNGVRKTFAELIEMDRSGEEIYGYAFDRASEKICMTKLVAPRKTRTTKKTACITLDNGDTIHCTLDHIFYGRNGQEIRAAELTEGVPLLPLYTTIDTEVDALDSQRLRDVSGYDVVYQPLMNTYAYAHRLADDYNERNGLVRVPEEKSWCRHHNDFNKSNNMPTNIVRMGRKEHWQIHATHARENNLAGISGFDVARQKYPDLSSKAGKKGGPAAAVSRRNNPEMMKAHRERAIERLQGMNANPTEAMLEWRTNPERPKISNTDSEIIHLQKLGKIRSVVNIIREAGHQKVDAATWNEFRTCVYNGRKWESVREFLIENKITEIDGVVFELNHSVTSVEFIEHQDPIDVYCLTSPEFETFALAAGVFVHNCGMNAVRTSLRASDLPDNLKNIRGMIEQMVPVGNADHGWNISKWKEHKDTPKLLNNIHAQLEPGFNALVAKHPNIEKMGRELERRVYRQIGTLGGGNHFIELCLDENQEVWVMLHSGSRNPGNCIGRYFIELAKKDMERHFISLPDKDLAYLVEGTSHYDDYVEGVSWAQDFAFRNRQVMMELVLRALRSKLPEFTVTEEAVNAHHNYVEMENHFGVNVHVTRKGAIRARKGDLGIIPGSMGARSYIVRGLGNADSFCSAPHGAGRKHSRGEAKRLFTLEDHYKATEGVECRKDMSVLDETPAAYKDIDDVMAAAGDLVEVVHTLRQVICVKG